MAGNGSDAAGPAGSKNPAGRLRLEDGGTYGNPYGSKGAASASTYGGAYASGERSAPVDPGKQHGEHGATTHDGGRAGSGTNVNVGERVISVVAGGALAAYGLKRKDWLGAAAGVVGGFLVERGTTGHCLAYEALGISSTGAGEDAVTLPRKSDGAQGLRRQHGGAATVDAEKAKKVHQNFTIFGRNPDELYAYWRRLENLPKIFHHLERVEEQDARRSHWVAKAPAGQSVEWDAEIVNDVPGQIIAWRSLPGASVPNAGAVNFRRAPGNRGTEVHVTLDYEPPFGKLGVAVAKLFGEEPSIQVREDLRRYKQLMEAGEIPVSYNPGQGAPPKTTFDAKVNLGETGADLREVQRHAPAAAHQAVHQPPPADQARGANSTMTPKEPR